jgi:geranylgeranyl pyrophosphate synthase
MAIYTGGRLFALAMQVFASAGERVNRLAAQTVEDIWRGQTEEARNIHNLDLDESRRMDIIRGKTAAVYELSSRLGAMAAGLADEPVDALAGFGSDLGIAFQLVDDVMDIRGDERALGKPSAADLRGGVYTLPVIHALSEATTDAARLRAILSQREVPEDGYEEALRILRRNGSVAYALDKAAALVRRSQERLNTLPPSNARQTLWHLAYSILESAGVAPVADAGAECPA